MPWHPVPTLILSADECLQKQNYNYCSASLNCHPKTALGQTEFCSDWLPSAESSAKDVQNCVDWKAEWEQERTTLSEWEQERTTLWQNIVYSNLKQPASKKRLI